MPVLPDSGDPYLRMILLGPTTATRKTALTKELAGMEVVSGLEAVQGDWPKQSYRVGGKAMLLKEADFAQLIGGPS